MNRFTNISNTQLTNVINDWVKGERDRELMKRRLIDCICYEPLAEEFNLSVRQTFKIVQKNLKIISEKV